MHGIRESASFHGGMVTTLEVSPAVVVLNETDTVTSKLKFQNFSLRCDKSDPKISFQTPWNWEIEQGKKIAVIASSSFLRYQLIAGLAGLVPPVSGEIVGHSAIGWPVGGQGGLDSKLRISHALNFLSTVYSDCLENPESAWTIFEPAVKHGDSPQSHHQGIIKKSKRFLLLGIVSSFIRPLLDLKSKFLSPSLQSRFEILF